MKVVNLNGYMVGRGKDKFYRKRCYLVQFFVGMVLSVGVGFGLFLKCGL